MGRCYINCCCCCKYNLFDYKSDESNIPKFLIIGLNNSGKTTLLHRFMDDKVEQPTSTWGFTTETLKVKDQKVTFYDVGGSPTIRGIWSNYYAEVFGTIFVVDISSQESMTKSKEILEEVLKDSRLSGKPMLIFANKVDKVNDFEYMDIYKELDIEKRVADGYTSLDRILIYPCTCLLVKKKRDERIDSGMEWLLTRVKENKDYIKKKIKQDVEEQQKKFKLEQEAKKKRVEEYKQLRELQNETKQQEQQFINNTAEKVAEEEQNNVDSELIELLSKDQKEKSKSRSSKSVKIYPEEETDAAN